MATLQVQPLEDKAVREQRSAISWQSAAKIAWRELQASRTKFLFVILSVSIGVAALVGVRGFSESFQHTLLLEARTIMAADLSARMFRQPTPHEDQQIAALSHQGIQVTPVTEMVSMASSPADPVPLLISLKAVDPAAYPYYGSVQMSPAGALRNVLSDTTVVVGEDLLIRLKVQVGESINIGGRSFRIAAMLLREPDRMSSSMGLGPRVLISRGALEKTSLLQPGSRSGERLLFKLPVQGTGVSNVRSQLEKILPDAQVTDFRETSPALTNGLDRATGILSLICLVAMVLGAIGVAMAMRAHLQQRIDILAIMKSIGARSSDILRIYVLQTLLLGLAGGILGVLVGLGVEWVFPAVLGKLLPMRPPLTVPFRSIAAGLGTGVLTTLLFCLPPLLDIRKVRPNLVLRRAVESGDSEGKASLWMRFKASRLQWAIAVVIVAALGGIAAALSDSFEVGRWFAASLCALLVVTLALSSVVLRLLRAFLSKTRLHLPAAIRHALANLYRPGNQSSAVLAALGMGVMLILAVFLMEQGVIGEMHADAAPTTPNVFLVDIGAQELPGVLNLLSKQPGVRGTPETLPIVSGRIVSVDGVPTDQLKVKNYPKRLLQSVGLTWADAVPAGTKINSGLWWKTNDQAAVAVAAHAADRLHLHIGSEILFESGDRPIRTKVAAIFKTDGQHVYARSEFVLASGELRGLPTVWYADLHVDPPLVGSLQRTLFSTYPTITVINIADVIETIQGVVNQITMVVRFLAGFSMLSGAVILASSVASTRFRRIREVVVLKTLGATRKHIATVFSVEFIVLGLLAGFVGAVFANLLVRILLHKLDIGSHVNWLAALVAILATAVLATATGWAASFRILGQKPLEVLREE